MRLLWKMLAFIYELYLVHTIFLNKATTLGIQVSLISRRKEETADGSTDRRAQQRGLSAYWGECLCPSAGRWPIRHAGPVQLPHSLLPY